MIQIIKIHDMKTNNYFHNTSFNIIDEYWKPIVINDTITNYTISNYGRVYSYYCNRILVPPCTFDGYLSIGLYFNNKVYTFKIHRLVMIAFNPICNFENYQVNHIDGNKQNNRLYNLEWCTHDENIQHAINTGLMDNREHVVKMNKECARLICEYLQNGKSYDDICNLFSIIEEHDILRFKNIIHRIAKRETWIDVSKNYNISPKRQHDTIYSDEIIHSICKYLEDGKTYREIRNIFNIKHDDLQFKRVMYAISTKKLFTHISKDYDMKIPTSEKDPLFTEEQIHYICKMIRDENANSIDICKNLGIDIDSFDSKFRHCIINCISNIRKKKIFKYISDNYF